jgi:hypothetical protein
MKRIILAFAFILAFSGLIYAQTSPAKTTTTHVKKDGTPDKRFKENKDGGKPATTHLKKDGTPDKRFKENKDGGKPATTHLKKDGTPDKRFKENKPAKTATTK